MSATAPSVPNVAPADVAAWIALALSVLGLLVTVLLRYLDGPRARVRLRAVLLNVGLGGTVTYNTGTWPIPGSHPAREQGLPDRGDVIELAEIVVENIGRHPMTVYDVGFTWRGKRRTRWGRRLRHYSVPTPITPQREDDMKYAKGDRFRLEPADMVTLLVDYWSVVRSSRPNRSGHVKLRASVLIAGRRRTKRSRLKLAWVIPDAAQTAVDGLETVPLRSVIAATTARVILYATDERLGNIGYFARDLEGRIAGAWPADWAGRRAAIEAVMDDEDTMHFVPYQDARMLKTSVLIALISDIEARKADIDWSDILTPAPAQDAVQTRDDDPASEVPI
ncbi:hypothetical protein GCM10010489_11680 [Microbacterium saperdae]|nr:hypothetical protein GCM10010489_11680 [Microbacterium saperdae]